MVNINLYKKKKSKLKLTTILVLIGVFLLPVLALRLTLETIKQNNLAEIKGKYQYARSYIDEGDIKKMINRLQSENSMIVNKTNRLRSETERIKKDIVYAGVSTDFIDELGIHYNQTKATEKVFIESIKINRGQDFSLNYFNVNSKNMKDHQFSKGLKQAYQANGLRIDEKRMMIDFMLVNILQEELTIKTAGY